ncbi:MAG TPA: protein kinase [Gemmataceae bacterium]|nr:protein kinase [Gemmataceae bacterium]
MPKHFLVTSGPDRGLVFELGGPAILLIGRGRQATFRLNDPHVSRLHCQLEVTEERVVLRDAASLAGTQVNGQRVSVHVLAPGDVITLGKTQLRYQEDDLADQPTLPPDEPVPARTEAAATPHPQPAVTPPEAPRAPPLEAASGTRVDVPIVSREEAARPESPPATPRPEPRAARVGARSPDHAPTGGEAEDHVVSPPATPRPKPRAAAPTPSRPEPVAPGRLPILPAERMGELTGHVLSCYRIGPLFAKGRTGMIFRARDFKHHRDVALKILRPEFSENKDGVARFVRAMKTMLPLRHPNIVALYGAGKTGPYCWLAMEYIDGESLAQVLHRIGVAGMLDWRFTLRIAVDLARGLQFAHEHQIIHRNITPQNTLLRASDKRALLGDLMLAKALEGALAANVTRIGEVIGDIRFMSPERLAGDRNVDARSDIYSLGALIYALLTGHAPHEGETTMDTISMIYKMEPVRPKKFQMSIATPFESVVMTMLNKYPEKRYQSAEKVVADLETVAKFQNIEL